MTVNITHSANFLFVSRFALISSLQQQPSNYKKKTRKSFPSMNVWI